MPRVTLPLLMGLGVGCAPRTVAPPAAGEGADRDDARGTVPWIVAHRGASGVLPEHTLAAYALAIEQGADAIEPDLVSTRDGVLVCRHDRYLSTTTDVADHVAFADRRREDTVHGAIREDWWVEDFTLAELRTLRARQPRPARGQQHDGRHPIPTFDEVLALAVRSERAVWVVPELKAPSVFRAIGLDLVSALRRDLAEVGWDTPEAPVMVQSFEPGALAALKDGPVARRVQLVEALEVSPGVFRPSVSLAEAAAVATDVGPDKRLVFGDDGAGTDLVADAHARGLGVIPWTFRDDALGDGWPTAEAELRRAFELGVDGVFTDFPATGVAARAAWQPSGGTER